MTTIPGQVQEIRYERRPGKFYRHTFKPGVRMRANANGSVTLQGPRVIHADDRSRGFEKYLENPVRKTAACDCSDPGCPVHKGSSRCPNRGTRSLRRVDMGPGGRMKMCSGCYDDAMESGVFGNPGRKNPMRTRRASGGSSNLMTYLLVGGLAYWVFFKGGAVSWTTLLSGGGGSGAVATLTQAQLATLTALGSAVLLMGVLTNGNAALSDGSVILPNGTLLEAGQF